MNGIATRPGAKPHALSNARPSRFRARLCLPRPGLLLSVASLVLACLSTHGAAARAQDLDDVSFSGVVADQHGAVVPGASVTATLVATGATRTAETDREGRYRLVELQPGAYAVRAERAGFAAEVRREVSAVAGQSVRLDFTLRPAGLAAEQTVVSDAAAPAVDATRTVAGGTLGREELERLPVFTHAPLDSVFLLGGVTEEPLSDSYF